MVLKITQETFNSALKENIEDLGMSPEEALEETVKQFEVQGVDLSQIVKELPVEDSKLETIGNIVEKLRTLSTSNASADAIKQQLLLLKTECDKGIQHRVAAGKAGAYDILLNIYTEQRDLQLRVECLRTLVSLMTKQPDLFDDRGVEVIINSLKDQNLEFELRRLILRWTKECCVMHEMNRQKLFDSNIIEPLKDLLVDADTTAIIRDVLMVFRALVLDDDVRVEFGKAHEHARIIAGETLCILTALLLKHMKEEQTVHDIILTITSLMVRSEFCKKIEDAGGIDLIEVVLAQYPSNEKMMRQCFKLLKALAGNDDCKANILVKHTLQSTILSALDVSKGNAQTCTAGLSCLAALALRSPENSKLLFEAEAPRIIARCMQEHPSDKQVLKTASWAIRNMVSRSKYQCSTFLELGVEKLLHAALVSFKEIEYDTKAALRDLGCNVKLKEEWTGKGGALTTGLYK